MEKRSGKIGMWVYADTKPGKLKNYDCDGDFKLEDGRGRYAKDCRPATKEEVLAIGGKWEKETYDIW